MKKKVDKQKLHGSIRTGKFKTPNGDELFGALAFDGENTLLKLHHDKRINVPFQEYFCLQGKFFDDNRHVTLWRCNTVTKGETSADIEPNLVFVGNDHVDSDIGCISGIKFRVEDINALFPDHKAFSSVLEAGPFIEQIANANAHHFAKETEKPLKSEDLTKIGDSAQIAYFSGKTEIFSIKTAFGTVSAKHHPYGKTFGNVKGVSIKNKLLVAIDFEAPISVENMLTRLYKVLRFLELCCGRPQNLLELYARTNATEDYVNVEAYWPRRPKRKTDGEMLEMPWPGSALTDPIQYPDEYAKVLAGWINQTDEWQEAHLQFFTCLHDQRIFGPARITAAANMFDVMPSSALPPEREVSTEVRNAKAEAKKLFRNLPDSPDRQSVLNALGRIGKHYLRTKVLHRVKLVLQKADGRLPDLDLVANEAINCRNRYVHGTEGSFDYPNHFGQLVFFTETLEFVFAMSALIDVGWDFHDWITRRRSGSNRFSEYLAGYQMRLMELKRLVASGKKAR